MKWLDWLRRFRSGERGSTAVEFALTAPIAFALIFGTVEFGRVLLVGSLLESAVLEASRYGSTGYTTEGVSREERILEIVEQRTLGLVPVEELTISSLVYPSFDSIGQPEPLDDANGNGTFDAGETYEDLNGNGQWDADMGATGNGGPGDVVLYNVDYDIPFITPFMTHIMSNIALSSSTAIRNEPF